MAGTTTYAYSNDYPLDGAYTVANGTHGNRFDWHQTEDHTPGDVNGKVLIVNAEATPGEFYRRTITGLCQNTTYEFSAWLLNLVTPNSWCSRQGGAVPLNVTFEISNAADTAVLRSGDTGPVTETATVNWNQYGLVFNTGNETSVILRMINNGNGGCGNDLAIDDIEFKSCGDNAGTVDGSGNAAVTLCSGETPFTLQLRANPDGSVYHTPVYQWQESTDGTVWNNINGETNQNVEISVTATGFYRAKIAEVAANLNNDQCNSFSNVFPVTVNSGPARPELACWQRAILNPATCTWQVDGEQPPQPEIECWETATFNNGTCTWDIAGTQPAQPEINCWQTATFNTGTCTWDIAGTQPTEPVLECWENAVLNNDTCTWEVTGTQPAAPDPTTLECWQTATFNTGTCTWDIAGTQPTEPVLECWETSEFNPVSCDWEVSGTQPIAPDPNTLECWQTATFNNGTCTWDIAGVQPAQPEVECWQTATFNTGTCEWGLAGTQPTEPVLECWETSEFNPVSCAWEVTGTQPMEPDPDTLECGERAIFNHATCTWDVSGSPTVQPTIRCYETAVFNDLTCNWDVSGEMPPQPTTACWQSAIFNDTLCIWELSGTEPELPILACGEIAAFNTVTCNWEISGSRTEEPETACYETAVFNTATCVWEVSGSQPPQPILECGETADFNYSTCIWEITQNPTMPPNLECYQTATYDTASCTWAITGEQPEPPVLEYWEMATFNPTSCNWDISGSPTVTIREQGVDLCEGDQPVLVADTTIQTPGFLWNTGETTQEITVVDPGVYSVDILKNGHTLQTIIFTVQAIEPPIIARVTSMGNDIRVTTQNTGSFLFSLDGENYQLNNEFYNVPIGSYTVYVKDGQCEGTDALLHFHLDIPKFFTPNNDGINDTFVLLGIQDYPQSQVSVFDRYGKLLAFSNNSSFEWDGTYNNQNLPADDYWYRILIEGQNITGHITLKR